tara:strand:+ start:43 stop:783 length:741 start_codon:yes stop_codon:yes gene_type:complete
MIGASKAATTRSYQVLSTTNITSTGTQNYTVPAGVVYAEVELYGAGGGGGQGGNLAGKGGSGTSHRGGGGGHGGAYVKHQIRIPDLREGDTIVFSVGTAGGAAINTLNRGSNGGNTQLTVHKRGDTTITTFTDIIAGGGGGGRSFQTGGGVGSAGSAQGGNLLNIDGEQADARLTGTGAAVNGTNGGDAGGPDGGAGGAAAAVSSGVGSVAQGGVAPGGGGGGGASDVVESGENGASGKVIVKAYG